MSVTFVSLIAPIGLGGCQTSRQFVPLPNTQNILPESENGRVYVLNPGTAIGPPTFPVYEEGRCETQQSGAKRLIGKVCANGFLCWERPPGEIQLEAEHPDPLYRMLGGKDRIGVRVRPGVEHYVLVRAVPFRRIPELELIWKQDGQRLLKKLKPPLVDLR
jgi:hypothetical protein